MPTPPADWAADHTPPPAPDLLRAAARHAHDGACTPV